MQRTKQELIDIINDKWENARITNFNAFNKLKTEKTMSAKDYEELKTSRDKNLGYMEAYIDVIALLESTDIVNDTLCPTCKDKDTCYHKQRSGKEAIKCTEYNPCTKLLDNTNVVERKEPKNICDTCDATRDKYGLCMWIKGEGIKASQCGHYSKPKDTWKSEALGVNEPTCEKSANDGVKDYLEALTHAVPTNEMLNKDYLKSSYDKGCRENYDSQFREFVDSLDNQTYFVNAKGVCGLSIENHNDKYYINIYVAQTVMLEFETEQEQLDKYQELKEWLRKWN